MPKNGEEKNAAIRRGAMAVFGGFGGDRDRCVRRKRADIPIGFCKGSRRFDVVFVRGGRANRDVRRFVARNGKRGGGVRFGDHGTVCMYGKRIYRCGRFAGNGSYRQDFENAASLDTGYSVYAATGTTGEITMRANRVINGNASVFGGFDYRKENITWAKLFGVPENAFAIRSNTSYTVMFRYNVLTDPFLQLGEFYFIFNSKSSRQDRYFGFCSSGATAFRSGVTAYRLTPHDGYSFATVTLQTGDDDYTNCVFGIHLGGYVVIDDFAVYENAVLPAPETTAACTAPQEEESVFVADFSDSRTYALRSGAYFTATAENGGVTVAQQRRRLGGRLAAMLRLCAERFVQSDGCLRGFGPHGRIRAH